MPAEWVVSRVCEAFGCVPSVAVRELRRHGDLIVAVLQLRAYADAYERVRRAKPGDIPQQAGVDRMVDLVFEIEGELMRERRG